MLALLLTFQGLPEPAPPTPYDRVVSVTLDASDPDLAGRGRCERVEYVCEFSGGLRVWTRGPDDLDLFLRVEEADGQLVAEDDDSGGGKTPFLRVAVESGRKLVARVAASRPGLVGSFELCFMAGPDTPVTLAAAERAKAERRELRALIDGGRVDDARTRLRALVDQLRLVEGAAASSSILVELNDLATLAGRLDLHDVEAAALRASVALQRRVGPPTHPGVLSACTRLARAELELGHTRKAGELFESVLAVQLRTLPEDAPQLQDARQNAAATRRLLGDLAGARALDERILEIRSRTLPEHAPKLLEAKDNLSVILNDLGEYAKARALAEEVLAVRMRTSEAGDPDLLHTRQNLGAVLLRLGESELARAHFEEVLAQRCLRLPADAAEIQHARGNLAAVLSGSGDHAGARALWEQALAAHERTLPRDHPDLQRARLGLAASIKELGDVAGARLLEEQAIEVLSRTLPDAHPDLLSARNNLASTLLGLGRREESRALYEAVLAVRARTLPEGHRLLLDSRLNVASALIEDGEFLRARELLAGLVEARARAGPGDAPELLSAKGNLAAVLFRLGALEEARRLREQVLEARARSLPAEHTDVRRSRGRLAWTILAELARGRAIDPHAAIDEAELQRATELLVGEAEAGARALRGLDFETTAREADARAMSAFGEINASLTACLGLAGLPPLRALEPSLFAYAEASRNPSVEWAARVRSAAGSPEYAGLRQRATASSAALARLAHRGTKTEELRAVLAERAAAERALSRLSRERATAAAVGTPDLEAEAIAKALGPGELLVAYRRFTSWELAFAPSADGSGALAPESTRTYGLCAFVVRDRASAGKESPLVLVDLGAIEPVQAAVAGWRASIGADQERGAAVTTPRASMVRERGETLRRLILDPILVRTGAVRRIVIVPDDVLELASFDALPAPTGTDGAQWLGDRMRVEVRATVSEWLRPSPLAPNSNLLVAVGGATFNSVPTDAADPDSPAAAATPLTSVLLRGTAWERGFEPLPFTAREAHGLAALHAEVFGERGTGRVLDARGASVAALETLAARARWLHVATHGWYAPESIAEWEDSETLDVQQNFELRSPGAERIRKMIPLLSSGLALAGANLSNEDTFQGLLTADEVSTLDFSGCELVVLSACDTSLGEMRHVGQSAASLRKALHMAGARSVITSLWKVSDEATKELMLDFYRRLWVGKEPKWKALWEAKRKLREARDERGEPRYATRDWAAWVLTGEPE